MQTRGNERAWRSRCPKVGTRMRAMHAKLKSAGCPCSALAASSVRRASRARGPGRAGVGGGVRATTMRRQTTKVRPRGGASTGTHV